MIHSQSGRKKDGVSSPVRGGAGRDRWSRVPQFIGSQKMGRQVPSCEIYLHVVLAERPWTYDARKVRPSGSSYHMYDRFGIIRAVRRLPGSPHIVHGHAPCDAQCLAESVTVSSVHHLQKPADSRL